jgi:hypothetical protein
MSSTGPEGNARAVFARIKKNARAALGDEGHDAAVRTGEALTRKQAIELAQMPLRQTDGRTAPHFSRGPASSRQISNSLRGKGW